MQAYISCNIRISHLQSNQYPYDDESPCIKVYIYYVNAIRHCDNQVHTPEVQGFSEYFPGDT